jgi:hypothetical protein
MSQQILLQGKILGTEEFLLAGHAEGRSARSAGEDLLSGRSQWIALLCEVLPRALLAELGLARILLGSSGGGQFLVVLPGESLDAAEAFLHAAARQISELSSGWVKLIWSGHRQPGRLGRDPPAPQRGAAAQAQRSPSPMLGAAAFQLSTAPSHLSADSYFAKEMGAKVREASVDWMVARKLPEESCREKASTPGA